MGQKEALVDVSTRLFITVNEAAGLLLVDPRTIRRGIERGAIPVVKFGGAIRIPTTWIRQQAGLPESVAPDARPVPEPRASDCPEIMPMNGQTALREALVGVNHQLAGRTHNTVVKALRNRRWFVGDDVSLQRVAALTETEVWDVRGCGRGVIDLLTATLAKVGLRFSAG